MKRLGMFKEFGLEHGPSIKNSFSDVASTNKEAIIAYLENGDIGVTSSSKYVDVVTGEKTKITRCIMTDGEYSWPGIFSYYVEKYNLRLPEEFENKIMAQLNK